MYDGAISKHIIVLLLTCILHSIHVVHSGAITLLIIVIITTMLLSSIVLTMCVHTARVSTIHT
jgi:hypothetical protein